MGRRKSGEVMNLSDMEYYVEQLISLNSTLTSELEKESSQRIIDRFIQRRQIKQEARKQYYELQSKMDELLNDNPEFKEM